MSHLTLKEVIDRINQVLGDMRQQARPSLEDSPHRPEHYVPRLARYLAQLSFGREAKWSERRSAGIP